MKTFLRQKFLWGIVMGVGFFLALWMFGLAFSAWSYLPTQTGGTTLTATIWNNLINAVNDIGMRTDGITSTWVVRDTFTSNVAWSPITAPAGWTITSAACRRIGSFLQIKGYIYYTANSTYAWNTQVATLPSECWPNNAITAIAWSCWADVGWSGEFACHSSIGTDGKVYLLTQSTYSFRYFSFAGTFPTN